MEVAEHLPPQASSILLDSLTAASDCILFSAAIPYQLGVGHINPRWQSYWMKCFADRGYQAIDCIRSACWDNPDVEYWYAQNAFLYVAPGAPVTTVSQSPSVVDVVHPKSAEAYVEYTRDGSARRVGPTTLLRELPRAIRAAVKNRLTRRRPGSS